MKKDYIKPIIEIEEFELNAAIAAGCTTKVTLGPGDANYDPCEEYIGFDELKMARSANRSGESPFVEDSCSCYLTAAGEVLLSS